MSDDVHFIASPCDIDFHNIDERRLNECCRAWSHKYQELITENPLDLKDAYVLCDDKPLLEKINIFQNEQWRTNALGWIIKRQTDNHIPFFN